MLSFELSCSNLVSSELCFFPPTVVLGGSRMEGCGGRLKAIALRSHMTSKYGNVPSTSVCLLMDIGKAGSVLMTANGVHL